MIVILYPIRAKNHQTPINIKMTQHVQTLANLNLKINTTFVIKFPDLANLPEKLIQKILQKILVECHVFALLLILLKEIGVEQNKKIPLALIQAQTEN